MITTWLGVLNAAFAGAFVVASAMGLWIYRRDSGGRSFLWASWLSLLLAVVLAAGAIAIHREGTTAYPVSLGVRDVAQGLSAAVAVGTLASLVPALRVRRLVRAVLVVVAVHATLLVLTDLVVSYPVRPGADVDRGLLFRLPAVYAAAVAIAAVLAAVHGTRGVRRWLAGVAPLVIATALTAVLMSEPLPREEFTTLTSAAIGLGVLGLSVKRMRLIVRRRDSLVQRETGLTELAFTAIEQPDIGLVVAAAQDLLRRELGDPELTVTVGPSSEHGAELSVKVVDLRADARPFVDTTMRLVAGAVGRADAEDEIRRQATHHPVTGLPNQVLFLERLGAWLAADVALVVVVCRVHGLDTLAAVDGHDAGERAQRGVAYSLRDAIGPTRVLAQLSSGLFGILSRVPRASAGSTAPLDHRLTLLHDLIAEQARALGLDFSIGAAISTPSSQGEQLLRDATAALARSTERHTGYEVFDSVLGDRLRGTAALARRLGNAVDHDEIEVHYQPVVDAGTRRVTGFEALARWRDAGLIVPPGTWVPIAEVNGLIDRIGQRVLTLASSDRAFLGADVAVNVSPLQLAAPDFAYSTLVALGDCPPSSVVVEVTESAVMRDFGHAIVQLSVLRSAGVRIALDDFGTSYSSLSALADLPVDILKIDRSFTQRLDTTAGRAVIQAVITMAQALSKLTVVEGVETAWQFDELADLGVDRIQGFFVSRPMPLADALAWPHAPSPYRRARREPSRSV